MGRTCWSTSEPRDAVTASGMAILGAIGVAGLALLITGMAGGRSGWSVWAVFPCLFLGLSALIVMLGIGTLLGVAQIGIDQEKRMRRRC